MSQQLQTRRSFTALADALRLLHQRLLARVQVDYEKLHGRVQGSGALLQLAIHDPMFSWLVPLSQRIAELDDLEPADAPDLHQVGASVSHLLEDNGEFRAKYLECLQRDPSVVMAHAALRAQLPHRAAVPAGQVLQG